MRTSTSTDEQIAMVLRQHEAGTPLADICRTLGVSDTGVFPEAGSTSRSGRGGRAG